MSQYSGKRSIRSSPFYRPYHRAVMRVAGRAKRPAGTLATAGVIGRGMLFDAIRADPKVQKSLNGAHLPELTAARTKAGHPLATRQVMLVVSVVMGDLGYSRYSDHAWSRRPCEVA